MNPVVYEIRRAPAPVTADGNLAKPVWGSAVAAELVVVDSGGKPKQPTTVRMLYDDRCLYAAFQCRDTEVWGSHRLRDDPLWEQEVVEVFLCPSRNLHYYFEIEVNPHNVVCDLFVLRQPPQARRPSDARGINPMKQWDCRELRTAVKVHGELDARDGSALGWDVEMAIPFLSLPGAPNVPPKPGDAWLGNLYRIDRARDGDEYSALSPTGVVDYHVPERFAELRFAGNP